MANIVIETRLESLPGREVLLSFKFINQDPIDYYFDTRNLCSRYSRGLSINNTQLSYYSPDGWAKCESRCRFPTRPEDIKLIASDGVFEKTVNISPICNFLYGEPLGGEHYLRYLHPGSNLVLYDQENRRIDHITIPVIELPFTLIDIDYDDEEIEVEEAISDSILDSVLPGIGAVDSLSLL